MGYDSQNRSEAKLNKGSINYSIIAKGSLR